MTANSASRLLQHYVDNFRRLPWRSAPGEGPPDPYRVWLSEIMLQQTTVTTVKPRFERFIGRWPTIEALAGATDEDILSEWAGLGYYARARNLIACARKVGGSGGFPRTAAGLCELPGVGGYTAAAIAAIAFGEKAPAVDTNVERVTSRVHGLASPVRKQIERYVLELMDSGRPGDVVQALMDLGATICRPKQPRCGICPLSACCIAHASGSPQDFPTPRPRKPRPHRYGVVWWIERDGQVWLVRRPSKGLLGGMASLPGSAWTERPSPSAGRRLGTVRHVFSHFSLVLAVDISDAPEGDGWWQPIQALGDAGLPSLYLKAADEALRGRRLAA